MHTIPGDSSSHALSRWNTVTSASSFPTASLASSYASGKDNAKIDTPDALVTGLTVALGAVAFVVGVGVEVGKGAVDSVRARGGNTSNIKKRAEAASGGFDGVQGVVIGHEERPTVGFGAK